MPDSEARVHDFLADVSRHDRPYGGRDLAELREFAARELSIADLQPCDIPYASERPE